MAKKIVKNNNIIDGLHRAQATRTTKREHDEIMKYGAIYDHSSMQILDAIEEYLGEKISRDFFEEN